MSIQILPLSTPLPDKYLVNQNTITADWYSGDDAFKNGTYIISSSSYSMGYDAYNLVDGNDNTYWSSGVVNSTNNIANVKYTNNPYDTAIPASYIGGENDRTKSTYWKTTANHIQNSTIDIYGEWVQFQLPYDIYLTKYTIKSVNDFINQAPYKFALLCSNDGNKWTVLDIRTNPGNNTIYTLTIHSALKCKYYRLVISQVKGNTNEKVPVSMRGLELYGTKNIMKSTETFMNYSPYSKSIPCGSCGVKAYSKNEIISTNKILENFHIEREPFSITGNVDLNTGILYEQGNSFIAKRDNLLNNSLYDYSGNILYKNNGIPTLTDGLQEDVTEYSTQEKNVFILGTISVAIVAVGCMVIATSE
jgi:hypothetical protein